MKNILFLFLFLPSISFASTVVIFDTTTNVVTDYFPSAHTPDYVTRPDALINPDLSAVAGVPRRYWKHFAGAIIEMTQAEKDDLDAAAAAAQTAGMRAFAKQILDNQNSSSMQIRASLLIILDEVNILRQNWMAFKTEVANSTSLADLKARVATLPDTPDRTILQLKNQIKTRVDSGDAD